MLKNLRLEKILFLLESKEYVSIHELMEITSSSESTIRADLVLLEKENKWNQSLMNTFQNTKFNNHIT